MKLVYYSVVGAADALRERQLAESLASLRRHNREVWVFLVVYGEATPFLLREAKRWSVAVIDAGSYGDTLGRLHARGSILVENPTYHKLLSLRHLPLHDASQILYLDCDTFFFGDVALLFDACQGAHWYAREEPNSRLSHYGYDLRYLDETQLGALFQATGAEPVSPCNTGVCLMNFGMWWRLIELEQVFLDLAWRLSVGLGLVRAAGFETARAAATEQDRAQALPYPSSNTWIIEQVALWLTLGHIPGFVQAQFPREMVLQGREFSETPHLVPSCVVAHYFSNAMTRFFATAGRQRC